MKFSLIHGLVVIAILVPILFAIFGMLSWSLGCLIGEVLGLISYIWVGLSVRQLLLVSPIGNNRKMLLHSLGRYLMMALAIFWSSQASMINIVALVIGYSIVQLPAAIIRALSTSR